jgi:hypothetical protein
MRRLAFWWLVGLCTTSLARGEVVWLEAERPTAGNFPAKNPCAPADAHEASMLSGAAWIGTDGTRPAPLFLTYRFQVEAPGQKSLFARRFWKHGPFRWRIGEGEWRTVGRDAALLDRVELRRNIEANWVFMGRTDLPPGEHTLRIELTENKGPSAFDCFLITDEPFIPRGTCRPIRQSEPAAPEGWFVFRPPIDRFGESAIDLRHLNEKFAGENGRLTARGDAIVHEKTGEAIRLWGVNAGVDVVGMDPALSRILARQLSKSGVNFVRVHLPVGDAKGPDPKAVDRVQAFVWAMKQEGIYCALSIYFPLWFPLEPGDGFGSYNRKEPFGLVFFDPAFQRIYRSWFEALLTTPNPHAQGVPLGKDPAVAMVEMVNEDSLLFWTFKPYENPPAEPMAKLEAQFGAWLKAKYGSIDAAGKRWGGSPVRGDDFPAERVGIMPLAGVVNGKGPRAQDTATFLADTQAKFYRETQQFLREKCGYTGLTIASNWVTADGRLLGPLDKLSCTVGDVMDRHGYYEGEHKGPRSSFAIDAGDTYVDRSAARFDPKEGYDGQKRSYNTPIWDVAYNGKPSIQSETNWPQPNRFRAEMPLIAAAYGSLQGSDGYAFFSLLGGSWNEQLRKFPMQTPAMMGQFPAAALVYRTGLVKPADVVVRANLSVAGLQKLEGAPLSQPINLDELRAKDVPAGQMAEFERLEKIDPLSFCVGRVEMHFADTAAPSQIVDLSKFIDKQAKVVRSATGELSWDWGRGVITANAPQVQAAAGFLGAAGAIELGDCAIHLNNEYGAAWVVSLDGLPLATSRRILVQVMTEETNVGWSNGDGGRKQIQRLPAPPVLVRRIEGSIRLKPVATRATPLDFNGYPQAAVQIDDGTLRLRSDVLYYLVER